MSFCDIYMQCMSLIKTCFCFQLYGVSFKSQHKSNKEETHNLSKSHCLSVIFLFIPSLYFLLLPTNFLFEMEIFVCCWKSLQVPHFLFALFCLGSMTKIVFLNVFSYYFSPLLFCLFRPTRHRTADNDKTIKQNKHETTDKRLAFFLLFKIPRFMFR